MITFPLLHWQLSVRSERQLQLLNQRNALEKQTASVLPIYGP